MQSPHPPSRARAASPTAYFGAGLVAVTFPVTATLPNGLSQLGSALAEHVGLLLRDAQARQSVVYGLAVALVVAAGAGGQGALGERVVHVGVE